MKKVSVIILMSIFLVGASTSTSHAGWLFFSKPEFKGRILDAETKEPIQGAVVAAIYHKYSYHLLGAGTEICNTRETLTDEKGEFLIPSYYTIIDPFSIEDKTSFIFYKPGYAPGAVNDSPIYYFGRYPENFFTREIGERAEALKSDATREKVMITYGVVEMPKVKNTRKERLRAMPSRPGLTNSDDLPLLYKAINEENKRFGRGEVK
ncbi:MAG: hypothetical protein R6X10_06155 [Desulfobacterales bacterium]